MCSAFSVDAVQFVDHYVNIHKVASAEMMHTGILDAVKATGKPWIVSTGGAHISEVRWLEDTYDPDVILECVAEYPTDAGNYVFSYFDELQCDYGVSDHCLQNTASIVGATLGATVFEKHFAMGGAGSECPDWPVSVSELGLVSYVKSIRDTKLILANQHKVGGRKCELDMLLKWRRRVKAIKDISAGEMIVFGSNAGLFRSKESDPHAYGSFSHLAIDGRPAARNLKQGEGIGPGDFLRA
jgi:sialic acid synthase SpsE